jgi:hypothetical protein
MTLEARFRLFYISLILGGLSLILGGLYSLFKIDILFGLIYIATGLAAFLVIFFKYNNDFIARWINSFCALACLFAFINFSQQKLYIAAFLYLLFTLVYLVITLIWKFLPGTFKSFIYLKNKSVRSNLKQNQK